MIPTTTTCALEPCAVAAHPADPLLTRVFPAPERPGRSAFQRDRDRIVQARAFRRLAGKTQVFTSRASDHFRSRLTHTIEVVQIARLVAAALGLNEDLAETSPSSTTSATRLRPRGRARPRRVPQAPRPPLRPQPPRPPHVEHFEQRYAAHRGLNLTLGVREGIVKHSRDYTTQQHPELAGFFLDRRPPLEAQIIDLADEIAYLTADLDDGVESGLLDIHHVRDHVEILTQSYRAVEREHAGVDPKYLFNEALQLMQNTLTDDLIATTLANTQAIGATCLADVRAHPARLATFSPDAEAQRLQEKRYLYDTLYTCNALLA